PDQLGAETPNAKRASSTNPAAVCADLHAIGTDEHPVKVVDDVTPSRESNRNREAQDQADVPEAGGPRATLATFDLQGQHDPRYDASQPPNRQGFLGTHLATVGDHGS